MESTPHIPVYVCMASQNTSYILEHGLDILHIIAHSIIKTILRATYCYHFADKFTGHREPNDLLMVTQLASGRFRI